ncbi:glycosyltransferase family 2 protein [Caldisericum sp.]|uniref:glycosyltransferase family 2 protein n=1 Tax=Caldisericum sp. TaxID=2499687 RepID=UPI003D0D174D
MIQTHMLISFIILNYNGKGLTERCIDSLIRCIAGYNYEIIVVDNGSSDGSAEYLKNKFPSIKIIEEGFNKFIFAYNDGVKEAKGEWVFLLNNDMMFKGDFLSPLLEYVTQPDLFAVGSRLFNYEGKFESGVKILFFKFGLLSIRTEDINNPTFSFYIGTHGIFRREMFNALGGFDEVYTPFYFEDVDLCYRAWKRGWKVMVEPKSIIFHKHQATIGKFFDKSYIDRIIVRNNFIFQWKNITDKRVMLGYLFWIPIRLIKALLWQRIYYVKGFFDAVSLLIKGKITRNSSQEDKMSDKDIFNFLIRLNSSMGDRI